MCGTSLERHCTIYIAIIINDFPITVLNDVLVGFVIRANDRHVHIPRSFNNNCIASKSG